MIGTGIFNSASVVFANTQSIGASLWLWVYGSVVAIAGVLVYNELGLSMPQWRMNRDEVAAPRSGGELNYFNYFKSPQFLATCVYGISFLILGTTAANSVAFAHNTLDAANVEMTPGKVFAVALAGNTFCCLLHSISRKWGIVLNNFLGCVKVLILVFAIVVGLAWVGSDFNKGVAPANFASFSTSKSPSLPYSYAEAVLFVLFAFGGFHQINYVLAEIKSPKRTFPLVTRVGVGVIVLLFLALNVLYAVVVPQQDLFTHGTDVGLVYFQRTLGKAISDGSRAKSIWEGLKATSAMGNIIVVTFVASRVKQEIAKEGILYKSKIFAKDYDVSLRRLFRRRSAQAGVGIHMHSSTHTPAAALLLHWFLTNLLIIITLFSIQSPVGRPYDPVPTYTFLVSSYTYVVDLTCFAAMGLGLLYLRFKASLRWEERSQFKHPWISIGSAATLLVLSLFPLVVLWIPDPAVPYLSRTDGMVPWYAAQTLGVCAIASGILYWVVFRGFIRIRKRATGLLPQIVRVPCLRGDDGGWIQFYEFVKLDWDWDGTTQDDAGIALSTQESVASVHTDQ